MELLWTIAGVVVPLLIALGMALAVIDASPREFNFSKGCFVLSALLMAGLTMSWILTTESSLLSRVLIGSVVGFLVFVLFPESLRWVTAKEQKQLKSKSFDALKALFFVVNVNLAGEDQIF